MKIVRGSTINEIVSTINEDEEFDSHYDYREAKSNYADIEATGMLTTIGTITQKNSFNSSNKLEGEAKSYKYRRSGTLDEKYLRTSFNYA